MEKKLQELKTLLTEATDLWSAAAVLGWDQQVFMPPGGAQARGRQLATLERLYHDKLTDPAIGRLLDELQPWTESLPYDSDEAGLIRCTRREVERRTRVPSSYVQRAAEHHSHSFQAWAQARPQNDFAAVIPYLEETLDLSREFSGYFPGYDHIADPLIDVADYGMKATNLRELFGRLREQLVPIVHAITAQPPADNSCLSRGYPQAGQKEFLEPLIAAVGYDLSRGRHDSSPHPFTTAFSAGDVRITVRYREDDLGEAVFGFLHEGGHAMYEQGSDPAFDGTPLSGGTSSGVHESQSRLWENVVGRGRGFWSYWYPRLQASFSTQLGQVSLETFYRAINKVQPSLIRTEADEVTYNLHVMIRFGLELDLLEGKLAVRDLAEAWRERYQADLGISPRDDRDGVLQDIHWYGGVIGGAFQGYTLGNILSVQFYEAACQAHPEMPSEISQGHCGSLLGWLQSNIYRHGSKYTAPELIQRVTGGPLRIEPYIRYLRTKYGELYSL